MLLTKSRSLTDTFTLNDSASGSHVMTSDLLPDLSYVEGLANWEELGIGEWEDLDFDFSSHNAATIVEDNRETNDSPLRQEDGPRRVTSKKTSKMGTNGRKRPRRASIISQASEVHSGKVPSSTLAGGKSVPLYNSILTQKKFFLTRSF